MVAKSMSQHRSETLVSDDSPSNPTNNGFNHGADEFSCIHTSAEPRHLLGGLPPVVQFFFLGGGGVIQDVCPSNS